MLLPVCMIIGFTNRLNRYRKLKLCSMWWSDKTHQSLFWVQKLCKFSFERCRKIKCSFAREKAIQQSVRDFLGVGPVVKNPPSNAGDESWIPGRGTKIPHAMQQLSLCAVLQLLSLYLHSWSPRGTVKTWCSLKKSQWNEAQGPWWELTPLV